MRFLFSRLAVRHLSPSITSRQYSHVPVLLEETMKALQVKSEGIYLDCTFGNGGHSCRILDSADSCTLYGSDRDLLAFERATELAKTRYPNRLIPLHSRFSEISHRLQQQRGGKDPVRFDGILMDLGVSSMQIDDPLRGFSYKKKGPLDMRMSRTTETDNDVDEGQLTAYDVLNMFPAPEIEKILNEYGDERYSKKISQVISRERAKKPIETTQDLVRIVYSAFTADQIHRHGHLHPAARTFQALRIFVNDEMKELESMLHQSLELLKPDGGRLCVISFHSTEDRIVKRFMKSNFKTYENKVTIPSDEEIEANPRSRSSKLRVASMA